MNSVKTKLNSNETLPFPHRSSISFLIQAFDGNLILILYILKSFLFSYYFSHCFLGDLERRDLSHKEKLYLRELNVITETQCTLGKDKKGTCCIYLLTYLLYVSIHHIYIPPQSQNKCLWETVCKQLYIFGSLF